MKAGVHCSVRKGFVSALHEALQLGCDTLQMFTQSPRGWRTRVYTDEEFAAFRKERERSAIYPVVVHSPYLPNLSSSDARLYQLSSASLKRDLIWCEKLDAEYLVIHPGAYSPNATIEEGINKLTEALNDAIQSVPGKTRILIENMAGGGRRIGAAFRELGTILSRVRDDGRVGVCFDTCHAYAAGYDISDAEGVRRTLDEFDREIGLGALLAFHVNDSKGGLGSHRDLHQHIGQGNVGTTGFRALFSKGQFDQCPLILETPKQPDNADAENLKRLRACA